MVKFLVFVVLCCGLSQLNAQIDRRQVEDYVSEGRLRYCDYIYDKNIKTVQLYREGYALSPPVLNLGSGEKLLLQFDDLSGDYEKYKFTFIHCDAYWTASDLRQNEYLAPFAEDDIIDYKFSFNTLQKYVHYSVQIPSDQMVPSLSGNYLLVVYRSDNPADIVFSRRFMVVEQKVSIQAKVNRPVNAEYYYYRQEVDFSVNKAGYPVNNPYQDLKVVVQQNGRWDNAIRGLIPLYIKGDILDYNYEDGNVFYGGNEFRRFDIKSLTFYSEFIRKISKDSIGYEVFLKDDLKRTFKTYISDKDINGRIFIKSDDNVSDSEIEAEYVWVHFFLSCDIPFDKGSVYILGALTDWNFTDDNKMKYNYREKGYEARLYLKQGYYNYEYVFLGNGTGTGDETLIEGTHYETDNEYTIYVYNRENGQNYDVLIGLTQVNAFINNK